MRFLNVKQAATSLANGEIIAIPTETVYGLAADARCDDAVRKIFEAKGRPSDNPLIVHIGDVSQVDELVTTVSADARLLMEHFWPGPLTVILPNAAHVSELVTAGLSTIGLRIPDHYLTTELLRKSGIPLAAPSANLSGKPSPTSVEHVCHDMAGRIDGILSGGVTNLGLESTVIDMTTPVPVILRPGCITKAEIETIIGPVEVSQGSPDKPKAPGMKHRHYAPNAKLMIVKGRPKFVQSVVQEFGKKKYGLKIGTLCHVSCKNLYKRAEVVYGIKGTGQNLYDALRVFDQQNVDLIISEYFDDVAVMDRLIKASENRILTEDDAKERILSEMANQRN